MKHNQHRIYIASGHLSRICRAAAPAFALIAADGMNFMQLAGIDNTDFDDAREQLTVAEREIDAALEDLRSANDEVISTLDFDTIVDELMQNGLISVPTGNLYGTYDREGVVRLFGELYAMVAKAKNDISVLENLAIDDPIDQSAAFQIGLRYSKHYLALSNISTIMIEATRRAENQSSLNTFLPIDTAVTAVA